MTRRWMNGYLWRRAQRLADRVCPVLPPAARVLDVGSGTGHNAATLTERGFDVTTTDVADLHVVGPPPVRCVEGRLPFEDDAFDVAILLYVLQYVDDVTTLLREATRVAPRAIVLQSTYRGRAGRAYLAGREALTGRVAFRAARAMGFVADVGSPLDRVRLVTREALTHAAEDARVEVVPATPPSSLPVSRDLLVMERAR